MEYLVIYEKSQTGWGAYVPDLPGLGVAGKNLQEVKALISEAIDFHLEGIGKKARGQGLKAKSPKPKAQSQ